MPQSYNCVIVGGGAAGFFAAIHHKDAFPDDKVLILEKGRELLSKVRISGGGRCNVTHACFDPRTLVGFYPRGAKALMGPFSRFQPEDTVAWFSSHGVALKTESDGRMFPTTNDSGTIVDCLMDTAKSLGVEIWTECGVNAAKQTEQGLTLRLSNKHALDCEKLILATGSSRGGHELARNLGHEIVRPIPSLFSFKVADRDLHQLSGLSVASATSWLRGREKHVQTGPVLVTHWGFSGPAIIRLSAWEAKTLYDSNYQADLVINWLPDYDVDQLVSALQSTQEKTPDKRMEGTSPFAELPQRLWVYLLRHAGLSAELRWKQLSPKQSQSLAEHLLRCPFPISGKGQFKEEFVTCGGVALNDINFKTMESKVCPGLYVIGEALDIDGVTGGFNFQNAWTTGYLAGTAISSD